MTGVTLFEQLFKGEVWRLEVVTYKGRCFVNFRKWYRVGDELRPSKEGCTIPLERLPELYKALGSYLSDSPQVA